MASQNPATNTDIFLTYSDNDGRTWSTRSRSTTTRPTPTASPGRTRPIPTTRSPAIASTSRRSPWTRRPGPWSSPGVTPVTTPRTPWWRPTSPPASTAATPSAPRSTPTPQKTAIDAITGQTDVLGPEADNGTAADNAVPNGAATALVPRWAWPSTPARSTRCGPAISTRPILVNGVRRRQCPVHLLPADGHRGRAADRQQHHGAGRGRPPTSFTGTLTTGSALVTGVTSTTGLFAGEKHYRHRYPVWRDDLDRQQFHLDHVVGGRDGQRRPRA